MKTVDINVMSQMSPDERTVFLGWLMEQGVDLSLAYQVDIEGDKLYVWNYKLDRTGHKYIDEKTDDAAREADPVELPIKTKLETLL